MTTATSTASSSTKPGVSDAEVRATPHRKPDAAPSDVDLLKLQKLSGTSIRKGHSHIVVTQDPANKTKVQIQIVQTLMGTRGQPRIDPTTNEPLRQNVAVDVDISTLKAFDKLMGRDVLGCLNESASDRQVKEALKKLVELGIVTEGRGLTPSPSMLIKEMSAALDASLSPLPPVPPSTKPTNASHLSLADEDWRVSGGKISGAQILEDVAMNRSSVVIERPDAGIDQFARMKISHDANGVLVELLGSKFERPQMEFAVRIPGGSLSDEALIEKLTKIAEKFSKESLSGAELMREGELIKDLRGLGELSRIENVSLVTVNWMEGKVAKDFVAKNVFISDSTLELVAQPGQQRFEMDGVVTKGQTILFVDAPATEHFQAKLSRCSFGCGFGGGRTTMDGSLIAAEFERCSMRGVDAINCDLTGVGFGQRGYNVFAYRGMTVHSDRAPKAMRKDLKFLSDSKLGSVERRMGNLVDRSSMITMFRDLGYEAEFVAPKDGSKYTHTLVVRDNRFGPVHVNLNFHRHHRSGELVDLEYFVAPLNCTPVEKKDSLPHNAFLFTLRVLNQESTKLANENNTAGAAAVGATA